MNGRRALEPADRSNAPGTVAIEAADEVRSQLSRLYADPFSPMFRKRSDGHIRGVDFYTASNLVKVLFHTFPKYKAAHGRYPDLLNPTGFSEKIYWSKFFAERKVPEAGNKLRTGFFIPDTLKDEIHLPERMWKSTVAQLPSNAELPPGCYYLKTNHGSDMYRKIEYPLDVAERQELERQFERHLASGYGFATGEWWYNAFIPEVFIERSVAKAAHPVMWCHHVFSGEIGLITAVGKVGSEVRSTWFSPDHVVLAEQNPKHSRPEYDDPGAGLKTAMKEAAALIGAALPYARIDFLIGDDERLYLGEVTFSPSDGLLRWPEEMDRRFGSMWNIER